MVAVGSVDLPCDPLWVSRMIQKSREEVKSFQMETYYSVLETRLEKLAKSNYKFALSR